MNNYSDFVIYVDESGDHALNTIDPDYPVFVLTFSIFNKKNYIDTIVPTFQEFKFKYFGHDIIIFHENEIRRRKNGFKFLYNKAIHTEFINELSEIINQSNFNVISCVIHKEKLKQNFSKSDNPYHIALNFCLQRVHRFLNDHTQERKKTHIIFEKRGKKEDDELELEFRRLCDKEDYPFEIILADKKTNSVGLQLSDMIARPIGRKLINSSENNRAYDIIKKKLYGDGISKDMGLKIYP